jgi:hypothetical protein
VAQEITAEEAKYRNNIEKAHKKLGAGGCASPLSQRRGVEKEYGNAVENYVKFLRAQGNNSFIYIKKKYRTL